MDLQLIKQLEDKRTGANVHGVNTAIWYLKQEGDPEYKFQDHTQKVKEAARIWVNGGSPDALNKILYGKDE